MSRKFKVPLNLVGLTTDPGSATNGDLYFNTVSNKVRYYTNNAWQDLGAAAGGASVQVSTTIPAIATEGKLWYDNDDARLYVFDGTYWVEVSIGPVGPAGPTGAGVATAGTTGQYLVKSSNNNYETSWSTLAAASLTSTDVSRLTGATSNLQTQINTLSTNLGNTLDDYVPIGDVGVADGVASLDSSGKIPIAQLGNLIDGAPAALDTLNELAAAINDDASYAAGITTALGTKISNAGGDIITSSLPGVIPVVLRGAASQTANLQEWQNSSGQVGPLVNSAGVIIAKSGFGGVTTFSAGATGDQSSVSIYSYNAARKGLVIKGIASQTANLQEWQNSSGTVLASIASNGAIQAGTYNGVVISLNYPGIVIDTSNADSTQVWLRNLSATSKGGRFVGIKARNGYANAVAGDDLVTLAGEQYINSLGYESAKILMSNDNSTPSTTSYPARITFHTTAIDSTTLTERMRISSSGNVLVNGFTAPTVGLSVKGAASQTANLQEWQNSTGTVLAKITASGALDATAITVNGSAISGGGLSPVAVSTNITMVASTRYFVDTASTRILTLPATPALGAEIELYDASNNAFTNNVSILRNGQKINGLTDDAALDINGFAVSFIYTGSTYGWRIK